MADAMKVGVARGHVVIEVALRVQRMAEAPDTEKVMNALPATGPLGDPSDLVRTATTIEQVRFDTNAKTTFNCSGKVSGGGPINFIYMKVIKK